MGKRQEYRVRFTPGYKLHSLPLYPHRLWGLPNLISVDAEGFNPSNKAVWITGKPLVSI